MANKVRGAYTLDVLADELVGKLVQLQQTHAKGSGPDVDLKALMAEGEFDELWRAVVSLGHVIFLGEAKEAPDLFNVMFELFDTVDKEEQEDECRFLAGEVVKTVVGEGKVDKVETRMAVLANLYNAAFIADKAFQEFRLSVLRALLSFARTYGKVSLLESFLADVDQFSTALKGAAPKSKRETLLAVYDALHDYGESKALEQRYLVKYLQTFDPESEHAAIDSGVQSLACTAISACIGNVLAADGRLLLNLAAVRSLASSGGPKAQLYTLLGIFNNGLLPDYIAFQAEHPAVLAQFEVDHAQAVRSMRLLSLCTACNRAKDGQITYEEAGKTMGLEGEEGLAEKVEEWVLNAIKTGLVDVKMCQQSQKITVFSSTQRNFQPEQWKEMHKKVTRWKTQINKLLVTVQNIKANQLRAAARHR